MDDYTPYYKHKIILTTQQECGSRFGVGDIVYASIDNKVIKQFKITIIFIIEDKLDIWYRLEPCQFLPESRVFKSVSECRNNLIRRYNNGN